MWDLFKKLLPQQCLGFIWSKRSEPGNEHLACTVHATITHFNDVSNCVITTILGNARMMAWEGQRGGALGQDGQEGVVHFLGTFLTDLLMLDAAMEEYLEGDEINHQRRIRNADS
ncbi:Ral guanine nucleotide dissociation stimulator [Vulpes lagopus]